MARGDVAPASCNPILLFGFDFDIQAKQSFGRTKWGAQYLRKMYTDTEDRRMMALPKSNYKRLEIVYGNNMTVMFRALLHCSEYYGEKGFWTAIGRGFDANAEDIHNIASILTEARRIGRRRSALPESETARWADRWLDFMQSFQYRIEVSPDWKTSSHSRLNSIADDFYESMKKFKLVNAGSVPYGWGTDPVPIASHHGQSLWSRSSHPASLRGVAEQLTKPMSNNYNHLMTASQTSHSRGRSPPIHPPRKRLHSPVSREDTSKCKRPQLDYQGAIWTVKKERLSGSPPYPSTFDSSQHYQVTNNDELALSRLGPGDDTKGNSCLLDKSPPPLLSKSQDYQPAPQTQSSLDRVPEKEANAEYPKIDPVRPSQDYPIPSLTEGAEVLVPSFHPGDSTAMHTYGEGASLQCKVTAFLQTLGKPSAPSEQSYHLPQPAKITTIDDGTIVSHIKEDRSQEEGDKESSLPGHVSLINKVLILSERIANIEHREKQSTLRHTAMQHAMHQQEVRIDTLAGKLEQEIADLRAQISGLVNHAGFGRP